MADVLAVAPLVIGGVLVALAAFAGASAAVGFHFAGRSLQDSIAEVSHSILKAATGVGGVFFISAAQRRRAEKEMRAQVSRAAGARVGVLAGFYGGIAAILRDLTGAMASYAGTAADAIEWQGRVAIPREAKRAAAPATRTARQAQRTGTRAQAKATRAAAAAAGAAGIAIGVRGGLRRRGNAWDRAIDRLRTRAGRIERTLARHQRLLARLAKLLTAAGALALVTTAILRKGFRFWRCSAFNRVGRSLNCAHWSWLESVFLLPVVALVASDVCRIADAINATAGTLDATVVRPLVGLTDNICTSGGATKAWGMDAGGYSGSWQSSAI